MLFTVQLPAHFLTKLMTAAHAAGLDGRWSRALVSPMFRELLRMSARASLVPIPTMEVSNCPFTDLYSPRPQ